MFNVISCTALGPRVPSAIPFHDSGAAYEIVFWKTSSMHQEHDGLTDSIHENPCRETKNGAKKSIRNRKVNHDWNRFEVTFCIISWLTMSSSSSPHVSKRDGQTKTTLSEGKINSLTNQLQEETILEKQTVRISPSLYKRNVPISTFFMNGHHKGGGIDSSVQADPRLYPHPRQLLPSVGSATAASNPTLFANSNSKFAHKECQTENYLSCCNIELNSMANCTDDRVNPETDHELDTSIVDHENEKLNELSQESDLDSKDRELEHINAIVSESKYTSKTSIDQIDSRSIDRSKQNGLVPTKVITDTECGLKKDAKQFSADEEEEDSCCMNCFLVTLNVCECVIL